METLAIVNEFTGEPTGILLSRKKALENKAWCMSTNIFVINPKGQILCHKRSQEKERFPGMWFTHLGGHVGHEESYHTNAIKELEEEMGVKLLPKELTPWRTTRNDHSRLWIREFVTVQDLDIAHLTPQPGEVDAFAWKHLDEILAEHKSTPELWKAGTYDLWTEYHCMMSVITVLHNKGFDKMPPHLLTWGAAPELA